MAVTAVERVVVVMPGVLEAADWHTLASAGMAAGSSAGSAADKSCTEAELDTAQKQGTVPMLCC